MWFLSKPAFQPSARETVVSSVSPKISQNIGFDSDLSDYKYFFLFFLFYIRWFIIKPAVQPYAK